MALVTLEEAKEYLRVSTSDEDAMISSLISAAELKTRDIGRISDERWAEVIADPDAEDSAEVVDLRPVCKVAVLYTTAYLFEHREEADHHGLDITLRNWLSAVREGVV